MSCLKIHAISCKVNTSLKANRKLKLKLKAVSSADWDLNAKKERDTKCLSIWSLTFPSYRSKIACNGSSEVQMISGYWDNFHSYLYYHSNFSNGS